MSHPRWDTLLINATLATFAGEAPYGLIEHGAIAMHHGRIAWLGRMDELPGEPATLADTLRSLDGALVTPGLIDCHTHLVFGGDRAHEFDLRLNGASYEEIARAGGGIASSVTATRAASEEQLLAQSLPRARALLADGVTTLEIKSGYGLDLDSERRMLRVARRIGRELGIGVRTSFLGLHALPPEYKDRRDDYVALACDEMLPALAAEGLVDAVDAFCEGIGFSREETRRVFERAKQLGLPVKLHAEQLSDLDGAALVAEYGGLSADHLEHLGDNGIRAMAAAGTVAVLLPGAFYALRETKLPPIERLREHAVPIAIATDCNPGTSPLLSLRLAAGMACTLFRLTPEEALRGVTVHAARALGLHDRGTLAVGQRADLAVWQAKQPAELCYWIGGQLLRGLWIGGESVPA
ncbi:imidazolonepropionase [Rhodanobacter sp. Root179]|uniref:imidazolonepropionase n=1 Tax=unclassified Rhodanobacter TaxID=2621553 RepID=UPI0006FE0FF5|nr:MULTISPECIES: imidazolonepropionase [unclassified Rhodanobacter]KRB35243.1 imidazolonepropionase [Rhodanobacter sp. Root179]QRP62482.1 imidazolonepropionase [Rhodanobacter sp. FDAARGOS 1247]